MLWPVTSRFLVVPVSNPSTSTKGTVRFYTPGALWSVIYWSMIYVMLIHTCMWCVICIWTMYCTVHGTSFGPSTDSFVTRLYAYILRVFSTVKMYCTKSTGVPFNTRYCSTGISLYLVLWVQVLVQQIHELYVHTQSGASDKVRQRGQREYAGWQRDCAYIAETCSWPKSSETSGNARSPLYCSWWRVPPRHRAAQQTVGIFRMSRMYVVVDIFVDTSVRLK